MSVAVHSAHTAVLVVSPRLPVPSTEKVGRSFRGLQVKNSYRSTFGISSISLAGVVATLAVESVRLEAVAVCQMCLVPHQKIVVEVGRCILLGGVCVLTSEFPLFLFGWWWR